MRMIALAPLLLAACAHSMDDAPDLSAGEPCNPAAVERFAGSKATQDIGAEMMAAAGARTLRWAPPDSALTMDYRPDRLTVHLDKAGNVVRAECG